jgi:hypothetical protein
MTCQPRGRPSVAAPVGELDAFWNDRRAVAAAAGAGRAFAAGLRTVRVTAPRLESTSTVTRAPGACRAALVSGS